MGADHFIHERPHLGFHELEVCRLTEEPVPVIFNPVSSSMYPPAGLFDCMALGEFKVQAAIDFP